MSKSGARQSWKMGEALCRECVRDRRRPARFLLRSGRVTACDLENDAFIAWGNDAGNVVVYDVSRRKVCFRTARKPLDFIAAYPSPDKFGFLGLRAESASAFLGASNEILPSDPLPAALVSSCAGATASEFLAACRDGRIYQIQLNSGSIRAIADTSGEVIAMCAAGDARAYCDVNGRLSAFSNGSRQTVVAESIPLPTKLAVSENAALVACLYENEIVVYGVRKGAQPQRFAVASLTPSISPSLAKKRLRISSFLKTIYRSKRCRSKTRRRRSCVVSTFRTERTFRTPTRRNRRSLGFLKASRGIRSSSRRIFGRERYRKFCAF